jgi:hypothetical protein
MHCTQNGVGIDWVIDLLIDWLNTPYVDDHPVPDF